jgi:hypothetical protein
MLKTGLVCMTLSAGLIAGALGVSLYRGYLASNLPASSARRVAQPSLREMEGISDGLFKKSLYGLALSAAGAYCANRRRVTAGRKYLSFCQFADENAPEGVSNDNN